LKVLAPTAGPTPAARSADFIAGLCRDIDAEMIVIHVRSKGSQLSKEEEEEALRIFNEAGTKTGVKVKSKLVVGEVVESILGAADAENADLIVMGATGERELKKWIKGNVLIEVMERATVPVTIIPSALRPDLYA
jgi:nucleotide-binding universal stress UspA family protein